MRAGAERAAGVPALPRSAAAASLSRALCLALPLCVTLALSQSALSLFFVAASKLVSGFWRVLFSFLQLSFA